MKRSIILLLIITGLILSWSAKQTTAEIATVRDWIGLFPLGSGNSKTSSISWKYTGSCSEVVPGAAKLADQTGCNFSLPPSPTPGAYAFRLYANDQETEGALVARSKTTWVSFGLSGTCTPQSGGGIKVDLSWPALTGVDRVAIYRTSGANTSTLNPSPGNTTYSDNVSNPLPTYTYTLRALASDNSFREATNQVVVTTDSNTCNATEIAPPPTSETINCPALPQTDFNAIVLISPAPGSSVGLLSFTDQSRLNTFSTPDKCVIGNKAGIPQFSMPTFAEMKSIYFDQFKPKPGPDPRETLEGDQEQTTNTRAVNLKTGSGGPKLYYIQGNYEIKKNIAVERTGVIFVSGNLNITLADEATKKLTHTGSSVGLVFIVQGSVNIDPEVAEIDAYIISYGTFCSAFSGGSCPLTQQFTNEQLIIKGSVINPNLNSPAKFMRKYGDNTEPAEDIIYEAKYLSILKDIFARTLQIWSEVTTWNPEDIITPTPAPTPPATWSCGDSLVDSRDSQSYPTIQIGTQCWMAKNMNIGTRINGNSNQTDNPTLEKYCYGDLDSNCTTYGGLYQWDEAMQYSTIAGAQGICPADWHLPTHDEFTTLERAVCTSGTCVTDFPYDTTTIGMRGTDEGAKLQSGGSSGFNSLLSGDRESTGSFYNLGSFSYFWSSSQQDPSAWLRILSSSDTRVNRGRYVSKAFGFPIRCLKN